MYISYKKKSYHQRLSDAITWLRFPLIFLIIMLHCYSVQRLEGEHDTYFKVVYPFALWLGETGVPGFFFISGFLFFMSKKTYLQKIESRIHTLLVPYFIWNALFLILYLVLYALGHPLDINRRNLVDYEFADYLRLFWDRGEFDHGNFVPILCPMWYIRNLFIMSILSPILLFIIKYAREFFLVAIAAWWLTSYHNAFIPQTVLFFSLGAYFAIFKINPLRFIEKNAAFFLFLFISFGVCDIFVHVIFRTPINLQVHRLSLLFNIPALLLLADNTCRLSSSHRMQFLSQAAFIVFCIHYPIVLLLRKICIVVFSSANDLIHVCLYFICVFITTVLSICFYKLLDKYFPKIRIILSGNR